MIYLASHNELDFYQNYPFSSGPETDELMKFEAFLRFYVSEQLMQKTEKSQKDSFLSDQGFYPVYALRIE